VAAFTPHVIKNMLKNKSTLISITAFLIIIAITGIFKFSAYERQRDINNWHITLDALADYKAQMVNNWLNNHMTSLVELAENPSLQMYTQHLDRNKANRREDPAQLTYLRSLIESTAIRAGFIPTAPKQTIKASVAFRENQSLALYTSDLTLLTATKGTIPLTDNLRIDMANVLTTGKPTLLKMEKQPGTLPSIGFLIPVYGLQKGVQQNPVGILHGRLSPSASLFPLLIDQTITMGKSIETYLVRTNGQLITYLSPLKDGQRPLSKQLAANDLSLVAAQVVNHPGPFGSGHDYSGEQVLFTSRALNNLGWYLIQKINQNDALQESQQHSRFLTWTLLLLLLLILALISIVWKHGVSLRQQQAATLLRAKTAELSKQTKLLNSISDNMSDLILLIDEQDNILFINQAFASLNNTDPETVLNKSLPSLIGPDPAETLHKFYGHSKYIHHKHLTLHLDHQQYEFLATAVTIDYGETGAKAHLISLHDITKLNEKLRQNENLMKQTIQALMRAIDQHDPYSANHSAKTAQLVEKIALSLNLSDNDRQGLIIAATLCNLGKLSIPKDLLGKTEELSQEEKELLAQETSFAAEILTDVDFDWPVAETISLKTEFLDGSGTPKGLSGKEISKAGRILATANSFVAMTSPRPYREKLTKNEALNQLLELSDTLYDRKVVAALFNIIENEEEP
jgi:HD-GYP domain-containing protein (c-di-GMP phosphodiesterase class II)